MIKTNEELKPVSQDQTLDFSPRQKYYGNLITFCKDDQGQPRYMLGPHYILFLIAFTICSALILFIIYSYFAKFSVFWKVVSVVSGGGFILSYLNVGFSKPGIARAKGPIDSQTREEYRFCRICQVVRERRTQHCQDCNICIQGFDHHCPWVGKCVGKGNITAFYVFLTMTFANIIISFVATATVNIVNKKVKAG